MNNSNSTQTVDTFLPGVSSSSSAIQGKHFPRTYLENRCLRGESLTLILVEVMYR